MKHDRSKSLSNLLLVLAGTLILAFGTAIFIIPYQLITGGVVGYGIVISAWIGNSFLTLDLIVTILTWTLFFVGLLFLGWDFAGKTLLATAVYPIALSAFLRLSDPNVCGGFFYLQGSAYADIALLVATLLGGALIGVGCAVTFRGGGSTGGVDILAFVLCKKLPRLKHTTVIFVLDAIGIVFGLIVLRDLVLSLLGAASAFAAVWMIDRVFLGGSRAYVAQIVSEHCVEINRAVIERLERTTTILTAQGGFSGREKRVVMLSFSMRQYAELMRMVKEIDRNAFVTVYRAHAVNGEGWSDLA